MVAIELRNLPEYEASRSYIDRRGWVVYARPVRGTWWTDCGDVGHAQTPDDELDRRAAMQAEKSISFGMVK